MVASKGTEEVDDVGKGISPVKLDSAWSRHRGVDRNSGIASPGSSPAGAATITYTVKALGTLGATESYATDLNNNLEAVGYINTPSTGTAAAFKWYHGSASSGFVTGSTSEALGLNDLGHVVGYDGTSDSSIAFAFNTQRTYLLRGLGGNCDKAVDINNLDIVAGSSYVSGNCSTGTEERAVLWIHRTPHDLGSLKLGGSSAASAINYKQMVTGWTDVPSGQVHGFFWRAGKMWNMGVLPSAVSSQGNAINSDGDVVGESTFSGGSYHAFFKGRKAKTMVDLGTLGGLDSDAFGIGRTDEVVGTSEVAPNVFHAFIWESGVMRDLNTLIPSQSPWVLVAATHMNDYGRISGWGTLNGTTEAFVLTPHE